MIAIQAAALVAATVTATLTAAVRLRLINENNKQRSCMCVCVCSAKRVWDNRVDSELKAQWRGSFVLRPGRNLFSLASSTPLAQPEQRPRKAKKQRLQRIRSKHVDDRNVAS